MQLAVFGGSLEKAKREEKEREREEESAFQHFGKGGGP